RQEKIVLNQRPLILSESAVEAVGSPGRLDHRHRNTGEIVRGQPVADPPDELLSDDGAEPVSQLKIESVQIVREGRRSAGNPVVISLHRPIGALTLDAVKTERKIA